MKRRRGCGRIKERGTRPALFAAKSAKIKLVLALLLNHKLSKPSGKMTYNKIKAYRRARRDSFCGENVEWKLSIGVVVGSMCIRN